ncbi:hypothetical protein WJX79_006638 [Trebouxia sp. C0005]|nr:MAG: PCI domain-containing 2-like [Trebouxia sp. A1-2]
MADFAQYVNAFAAALVGCNGRDPFSSARTVAALLQTGSREVRAAVEQKLTAQPRWTPINDQYRQIANSQFANWHAFFQYHALCMSNLVQNKHSDAYEASRAALGQFSTIFSDAPDNARWIVPIHHVVVHNMVAMATQADQTLKQNGNAAPGKLSAAATYLQSSIFSDTLRKGGGQKRYAALEVANTLFRVTFRLKNLRLADSIMKGVSHNLSPESVTPFNNFPMSQQVTYKFFEGRIAIFNELYSVAAEALTYACNHCHKDALQQKTRILQFLIPVQMLLGKLPSAAMRQKHNMHMYDTIIQAVRAGDVRTFQQEMDSNMHTFCVQGTFFLLEKLKLTVLRRLLMRCCILHLESCPQGTPNPHHFPLDNFAHALQWQGQMDADFEGSTLTVANLIHLKYVKGYISQAHRKLVLYRKADKIIEMAFPPLDTVDISKIGV